MTLIKPVWDIEHVDQANVALLDPTFGQITYASLRSDVAKYGTLLEDRAKAVGTDRLLIAIEMSARSPVIAAYVSALASGHVVLICAPDSLDSIGPIFEIYRPNLLIKQNGDLCVSVPLSDQPIDLHPDLSLLLSTSGTTGEPKLVRLSAENIASNAATIAEYLNLLPDDRAVTTLPLHYIFGLSVLHAHLHAGAALVLNDLSVIDAGFALLFAASKGTSISVVPHQVDLLLANGFGAESLPGLRHIAQAGGKLAASKVREMAALGRQGNWLFYVMYGQTEASPRMAYLPPQDAELHADCVGRPINGGSFAVRGESGQPVVGTDVEGDLIYSGPNVMMGYARTQADLALAKDTFELATGDVAQFTSNGFIKIVGRSARFAKIFGLRISLDQLDAMLRDEGFAAYAVSVEDRLVLLMQDMSASAETRQLVANAYKLPLHAIEVAPLSDVPTLPSGKVDFKTLQSLAQKAILSAPPQLPMASTMRQTMAEATRRDSVDLDESYTSLGGDSLGYLQVQIYLEKSLGGAPAGWENLTVRELEKLQPDLSKLASFWSHVEIDVVLRVVAITFIILVHLARLPLGGGTWLLLLVMGYSFSRFQRPSLLNKQFRDVFLRLLHPILLLYFILLISYQLFRAEADISYFVLLQNFVSPDQSSFLTAYWFVSLYAQLVVVLLGMFLISPVRQAIASRPWMASALIFTLTTGLAVACLWLTVDPYPYDRYPGIIGSPVAARSLIITFPIVVLGMMMHTANGRLQIALTFAGLVITCLIFPATSTAQPFILGAGGLLLMSRITIPFPAVIARTVTVMAASTLFVYLLHNIVVHVVRTATPLIDLIGIPAAAVVVVTVSFLMGHFAKLGFEALDRFAARRWRATKPAPLNIT